MGDADLRFEEVDPTSREAAWCLEQYYRELRETFAEGFEPSKSVLADASAMRRPHGVFMIARRATEPVACGVVKLTSPRVAYIKRMWVAPSERGRGLGRALLTALEGKAMDLGCRTVQLETNRALAGAIRLYRAAGYQEVAPFNAEYYAHHWFEKMLPAPGASTT